MLTPGAKNETVDLGGSLETRFIAVVNLINKKQFSDQDLTTLLEIS